jgi:long-chain acyl-CoA synthetase
MGLPLPDTEARIVDKDTGDAECAEGEIGELVVRGPQIMQGYWNNPALTSATLRSGWLHTGDLARMDQEGFFFLVDRKDDLILSSGFNIYPAEIEEVLRRHPKVKDAAAVGLPDRIKGQAVVAAVALKPGSEAGRQELMKYCKEHMPEYRVPRAILLVEEIPRDPAGKLLRRVLRQDARVSQG